MGLTKLRNSSTSSSTRAFPLEFLSFHRSRQTGHSCDKRKRVSVCMYEGRILEGSTTNPRSSARSEARAVRLAQEEKDGIPVTKKHINPFCQTNASLEQYGWPVGVEGQVGQVAQTPTYSRTRQDTVRGR